MLEFRFEILNWKNFSTGQINVNVFAISVYLDNNFITYKKRYCFITHVSDHVSEVGQSLSAFQQG